MRLLICLLISTLAACSKGPPGNLSPEEMASLVKACDVISSRHPSILTTVHLPSEAWPEAIVRLDPKSVRVDAQGVYLQLDSGFVGESGFFVPVKSSKKKLAGHEGDPSYQPLAPRLYWYRVRG
jgi:hypothetical protein